jgi:hypothetical protein
MKNYFPIIILALIIVFISSVADATTMTVYSKSDRRLKWYKDSMDCYKFGLWQVQLAKSMKDRTDTAEGRKVYDKIEKRSRQMNPYIKPIGCLDGLAFFYDELDDFWGTTSYWSADIYMKPRVTVLYKDTAIKNVVVVKSVTEIITSPAPEKKIASKKKIPVQAVCMKPADTLKSVTATTTYTVLPVPVRTLSVKHRDCGIWMPSGTKMSKEDFVARYGIEVYKRITNGY